MNRTITSFMGVSEGDNICFAGQRVVFEEGSHAGQGSTRSDLARLLPTLCLEGGPGPATVMAEAQPPLRYILAG